MRAIITGATGMVGEGVMLECVENPAVSEILLVSRRSYGALPPKVKELIVPDFMQVDSAAEKLRGYDACFFCAGVSSIGKSEAEYTRLTYDLTLHFAEALARVNPGMVFVYVSGAGTDTTEKGRTMWARVKGRTENALTRVGFKAVYHFRPGFMKPMPGQKNLPGWFGWIGWMYPVLRVMAANYASTLQGVGRAMIRCAAEGYPTVVLEVRDINGAGSSFSADSG
ncbi:MAG: NAD-dependent epimerase/dehydratase family protein [Acidobacteriota bacterium]